MIRQLAEKAIPAWRVVALTPASFRLVIRVKFPEWFGFMTGSRVYRESREARTSG